ncbi:MAG: glycosyltransferase family 2 protein [Patescibacteria group bacterium]|jgi:glycosyltransferase involved in cell wall biosynthesis
MKKISIITCTFNSAEYLQRNINSVKEQNFLDFEHIFIDGFSTDGTVDIIEKYRDDFPEKVSFFQFKAKGISDAMNKGVERSSGQYIVHLHSDDYFFDNNVLGDVINFLENNNYPDWIYGKISVSKDSVFKGFFPEKNIWKRKEKDFFKNYLLKFYNYIPHQSVFIKRSVFEKFGSFDENITSAMDFDFWLRIRKKTRWFYYNRVLSCFSLRLGSQSSDFFKKNENSRNVHLVQRRYLNFIEMLIGRIICFFVNFFNNNYIK